MTQPASINPRIVDGLYAEALILSDEVRAAFDLSGRLDETGAESDCSRMALSCEALRTTTRMMHAIAWLLNHRAFFSGELSEFQLKRYGRLPPEFPSADPQRVSLLEPEIRELIGATERFYARLARLDGEWRERAPAVRGGVAQLRDRLALAVAR